MYLYVSKIHQAFKYVKDRHHITEQNSSLIIIQGLLRLKIHLNCMTSASHILRTSVISQKQKFKKHEKRCQVKTQEKLKGKALKGGTLRVPDGLAYSQLH